MGFGGVFREDKLLNGITARLDNWFTGAKPVLFIYSCVKFNKFFINSVGGCDN